MTKVKVFVNAVFLFYLIFISSCKKEVKIINQNRISDSSFISITNASPVIPSLLLYLGNQKISFPDSPLSYGATTFGIYTNNNNPIYPVIKKIPYINIPSGYQQLNLGAPFTNNLFVSLNRYFRPYTNYSLFITDTVSHGQLQAVLLQDNVGETDSTNGQIRFLNLSPDAPPMDIWAFPNAGYYGYKLFSDCSYLPNDYNSLVKAESFSKIKTGPYYFLATVAGTADILLEGGLFIQSQSIMSIYSKGFVSGTNDKMLGIGVISYKP